MGIISRILLKFARSVVEDIMRQIVEQIQRIDDEVRSRLQSYLQEVLGGIWTGQGADAFVGTIQDEAMPIINQLLASITGMNGNIQNAATIIEEADASVRSTVSNLVSVFEAI